METVACELKYSGAGIAFLLAAVAASLGLVLALPLSGFLRTALMTYVMAQAARACRRLLAARALRLRLGGDIQVQDDRGRWTEGRVRDGSFVLPWLTIVRWRPAGARFDRTLALLPGMARAEDLRNIRVILRCDSRYLSRVYTTGEEQ